ncbi:glycoside hydrolase family 51 protein [Saccharata proteae CBS 121410]|uniref:non-reducing end alpha-L-arabinofuranosidase n=1 Tax=Saccharata proteae CBS 121410 TaxID=1314787 RepID=A0A9P4LY11_9PEZI|nr:glycoside hydrolase family 51 protein [Saccharata proteae CBS 121410]
MTTFTKIAETETPCITVNAGHRLAEINDNVYGGFTEHMGRCIYGGIYDPGNPLSDENGFRKDVIEAFKELNCPVVRYPGGNFCATYHWMDGVGPREERPARPELAWLGTESNAFGTAEFLHWCTLANTAPYLCLNMGTGTLDEALGWLEYCNGTKNTYYANLRRSHGHPDPYNVKYWALGNEVWGPWQVEQSTKEAYAHKAYQWAKALKLLDPEIELVLCGKDGTSSWDAYVLKECVRWDVHGLGGSTTKGLIDMHSIHVYTGAPGTGGQETEVGEKRKISHEANATAPRGAERAIEITASLIDLAFIENGVPATVPRPTICFDEWNVWDPVRAPGELGAEELYTLSDALAVGVWLNVFVRQARCVGMANIAQSVNVISPLMTTERGLVKQTTWWPLLLFSRYMRGSSVGVHVACGEWEGGTEPRWVRGVCKTPWLDVSCAVDRDGIVGLVVINVDKERDWETRVEGVGEGKVSVYTVTGRDVGVVNTEEKEEVGVKESDWDGQRLFTFPKASLTMMRWKT